MKRKTNAVLLTALTLTLSIGLTACAGKEKDESGFQEPTIQSESMESAPERIAEEEPSSESTVDSTEPASPEAGKGQEATAPDSDGIPENAADSASDAAGNNASGSDTLGGSIESLGDGSFAVHQTFVSVADDGSLLAFSDKDDKTRITVTYTDSTKFILRTVKNSGIDPSDISDAAASKDDLKQNVSVDLTGAYTDSGFAATEVVIYHFIY